MHRGRGGVRLVSMYESLLISFKQHKHICLDEISREKRGLIWEDVHTNTICVKPLRCRLETRRAQSDVLSYAQSLKVTFHQKIMQCICGTWLDVKVKLTKLKWSATFQILMLFIIFFLKQSHPDSYFSVGTLFEKIIIFNSNRILHKKRKLCHLSYSCCSKTTWWLSSTKLFFFCEEYQFWKLASPSGQEYFNIQKFTFCVTQNKESHMRLERWGRVNDRIFTFGLIIAGSYYSQNLPICSCSQISLGHCPETIKTPCSND